MSAVLRALRGLGPTRGGAAVGWSRAVRRGVAAGLGRGTSRRHSGVGGPVPSWTRVGAREAESSRAQPCARVWAPQPLSPQLRFSRRGHSGARPLGGLGGSLPSGLGGREKEIEKKQQPPASPFLSSRFAPPCSFSLPPSPLSSPLSPPSLFLIPATSSEPHSAAAAGGV